MKQRFILGLVVLLAACNLATSDKPMFSESERSAMKLKDGFWLTADSECTFEVRRPVAEWPKCADWSLLRDNKFVKGPNSADDAGAADLLIVSGAPPIMQIKVESDDPEATTAYVFLALEPRTSDSDGPVTSISTWAVKCGNETKGKSGESEIQRFLGFNEKCQPTSIDALRAAASASRPSDASIGVSRWIRAQP